MSRKLLCLTTAENYGTDVFIKEADGGGLYMRMGDVLEHFVCLKQDIKGDNPKFETPSFNPVLDLPPGKQFIILAPVFEADRDAKTYSVGFTPGFIMTDDEIARAERAVPRALREHFIR